MQGANHSDTEWYREDLQRRSAPGRPVSNRYLQVERVYKGAQMLDEEFHTHGPHDHEVEHITQHGGDRLTSGLAVLTAILSTIGAVFGYMAGHTQNEALIYKNDAAIQKTAASDQWNYYQAKSNKQNFAELALTLTSGVEREKYTQAVERYKQEKDHIKAQAEKLEAAAKQADRSSEAELHIHERWALAMTLLQVSIALAAITLLTRKRWLLLGVFSASGLGIAAGVLGYLHV